jgi:hypothetical protein
MANPTMPGGPRAKDWLESQALAERMNRGDVSQLVLGGHAGGQGQVSMAGGDFLAANYARER